MCDIPSVSMQDLLSGLYVHVKTSLALTGRGSDVNAVSTMLS